MDTGSTAPRLWTPRSGRGDGDWLCTMQIGVSTPELQAAARAYADAAGRTAALAAALAAEARTTGTWSYGALTGSAARFFRTLAWAATTGAAELDGLADRVRRSGDDYDVSELLLASQYGRRLEDLAPRTPE